MIERGASKNDAKLKKLRKEYCLSQESFALMFDIYQHQVSEWEHGVIPLSDKRLKYFVEELGNRND